MKRYLVTLTGRANLGCKGNKLREHDLCYSYVFGKNKDEAISKFWEQISNCSGLKGFERRDFKITAERWEKDSFLDVNGDVVTDIEWAIPFDLLASLEMIHDEHYQNYHLAIPLDFKIEETTNQANVDHPHPEAKYNVNRFNKRTGKDESMGIWLGDGMSNFKAGSGFLAGKFYCEDDEWIYYAEEQPQESSEPVAQENIQPELENATESISEPQRDNRWNVSVFFSKGQILDELFRLKNDLSSGNIVGCTKRHEHQMNRFIKALDVAIDCINEIDELSQKASQSSSDEEKEIAQENPQELTESNPEPLGDIKLSDFLTVTEKLENDAGFEWAYYCGDSLIWASSKRFSEDDLLRMYDLGYFMHYLTDKRKNLSRIQLKEYKTMGNTERCQNLWKQIEALDEEIARLFMNGARM